MPTYEYRCNACQHEFEQFQSITAKSLKKCPQCAKNSLERLISGGGAVLFKGSGFYETDYRSNDYKKKAEAETKGSSESKGESKPESKADSKSEPKPEKKPDAKPANGDKKPAKAKA